MAPVHASLPPRLALVSLAIAAVLPVLAVAADKKKDDGPDWSLCPTDPIFDFYIRDFGAGIERKGAPADFVSTQVTITGRSSYLLEGDVVATQADQRLLADKMTYDAESDTAVADGHVRYQDSEAAFTASHATSQLSYQKSKLDNVQYELIRQHGNGFADHVERYAELDSHLEKVTYSTCPPSKRDWEFHAATIDIDHVEGVGHARDATLYFKDVPILFLPYARFPVDDERHSGFLFPSFGSSSRTGFDLAVPYYLNLAPNMDATVGPHIYALRGVALDAEYRFLTQTQGGVLEGSFLPHDRDADRDRFAYRYRHTGSLGPNFSVTADINRVSDTRYFQDFGDGLVPSATSLLPSNAYLHGRGQWWSLEFGGDSVDITDPSVAPGTEPYERLPRLQFNTEIPFAGDLRAGLAAEVVRFDKDADVVTGRRYDLYPYLTWQLDSAAWYLHPKIGVRSTRYDLDVPNALDASFPDRSPSRTVPIASLDAGLYFDRDSEWFGRALRQTLEPRLYYLRAPYRNQDDLPLFDTQAQTFSFAGLFRENRFTGADRQIDANQLTLAMTSRLIDDASGDEVARAAIGETRYFDPQKVQLPGVAPTDFNGSAYAAEFELSPSKNWTVAWDQQWDPESDKNTFSAIRVQHLFGDHGVINASYRYRRDQLEFVDLSSAFPLTPNWRLITRYDYSLRDRRILEALGGFEYEDCCYAFRIVARHYLRNLSGEANNALFFELELKGLGSAGRKSGDFLRRAILGYR